jgi:MFS superfamily sulfate permease-like transporter
VPVIKGIQLGAALTLIISSGSTLLQPLRLDGPSWHDNLLLALIAFLALLVAQRTGKTAYALIIFVLGLILSLFAYPSLPSFTIYQPHLFVPDRKEFLRGALGAGLGQIPLTTLNSIIAIPSLCTTLLPQSVPPNVTQIGISVAVMNLVGGWFGAMPVCHGSGGLAGQYRFGARSGASVILLGLFKLILGLVFGDSLLGLLKAFPKSLLGMMVIAAGLELANVGESLNSTAADLVDKDSGTPKQIKVDEQKRRWTIMLVTVAGILAFKNDGVGFVAGMLCHGSYCIGAMTEQWNACRRHLTALYGRLPGAPSEHQPLLTDQP